MEKLGATELMALIRWLSANIAPPRPLMESVEDSPDCGADKSMFEAM